MRAAAARSASRRRVDGTPEVVALENVSCRRNIDELKFQLNWLGRNQQASNEALSNLAEISYVTPSSTSQHASATASSQASRSNSHHPTRANNFTTIQVHWRTCSGSKGCARLRYAAPCRYTLSIAGHLIAAIGFRPDTSLDSCFELIEGLVDGVEEQPTAIGGVQVEVEGSSKLELRLARFHGRRRRRLKLCPLTGIHQENRRDGLGGEAAGIEAVLAGAVCLADQWATGDLDCSNGPREDTTGSGSSSISNSSNTSQASCGRAASASCEPARLRTLPTNLSSSTSSSFSLSAASDSCAGSGCCHCQSSISRSGSSRRSSWHGCGASNSSSHSTHSSSSASASGSAASLASCNNQYEACQWCARLGVDSSCGYQQQPTDEPELELESRVESGQDHRPQIWCVQTPSSELPDNSGQQPAINGNTESELQLELEEAQRKLSQSLAPPPPDHQASASSSSSNLLNPMDMVWRGLSDMRALSCTEASFAGADKPGALAAQLAACVRSKSLGGVEPPPSSRQLKERLSGHANRAVGTGSNPLRFLQRVGKLTIGALAHIRLASSQQQEHNFSNAVSSSTAARHQRTLRELSTGLPTGNLEHQQHEAAMRGRSLSQRVLAHRARSSASPAELELVVPHQLAKFASASNLVVSNRASASGAPCNNQPATYDERLLYSREGVYMGPGALYSWCPELGHPSSAANLSGKAQAPALAGQLAVYPATEAPTTDPPSASSILDNSATSATVRGCESASQLDNSQRAETMIRMANGEQLGRQQQQQVQPPAAGCHQSQIQTNHQKARQTHKTVWLSSLTQRVHTPSVSHRDNNSKSIIQEQSSARCKAPKLTKETRSNSLTGPLSQQVFLYHRGTEVSKSSLELAQRPEPVLLPASVAGSSSELSQARRDLEKLLLESGEKNQSVQHQLLLESRSCTLNEPARTYGTNFISSCVHCQLIGELACYRASSAYLQQLLPDQLRWRTSYGINQQQTAVPVYPSVVLTVCSKQTTLEESTGLDEEGQECKEKHPREEGEEGHSSESDSRASYEGSDNDDDNDSDADNDDDDEEEEEGEQSLNFADWRMNSPRWSSLNSLDLSDSGDLNQSRLGSSQSSGGDMTDPEERPREHVHGRGKSGQKRRKRRTKRAAAKTSDPGNKHKVPVGGGSEDRAISKEQQQNGAVLLEVPTQGTKQARSASLDAPYLLKVPSESTSNDPNSLRPLENIFDETLPTSSKSSRSRSVDIALPASPGDSYQLVGPATNPLGIQESLQANHQRDLEKRNSGVYGPQTPVSSTLHLLAGYQKKKFIQGEIKVACANGETRALKLFVDWHGECINGEHLWTYAGSSSDACYVGESECLKHGARLSCSACKIMAHTGCITILIDKIKFICKHTFKDLTVNNPRHLKELQQENVIYHHWIHKRTLCGRCKHCSKTFGNTKLSFSSKEIQAITCSWCKVSYHNKENCYTLASLTEPCSLGPHRESIIPPTWIVKLPTNNTFPQQQLASLNQQPNQTKLCDSQLADPLTTTTTTTTKDSNETLSINNEFTNFVNSGEQNENVNPRQLATSSSQPVYGHELSNASVLSLDNYSTTSNSNNITTSCSNTNNSNNGRLIQQTQENIDSTTGDSLMTQVEYSSQAPSRHPQESTNQYQKHQLKQYYKQLDVGVEQMTNQTKFGDCQTELKMNDLHQKQHHHYPTTDDLDNSMDLYHNFKIIPQPIHGAPNAGSKPVLVFVNPRSGGNQGAKMMHKFNWLLNPRQVFDLIHSGGPKAALNLYRDVPNLRILTIGGDGTASWILSYLDEVGVPNKIPVAVLPLGTGNDLARALGWGGGYADEPIAKILAQVRAGEIVHLDRWNIQVERNPEATPSSPNEYSQCNLELNSPSITSSQSYFGSISQNVNNNNINTASTLSIIDQTNCDTSMLHGTNTNAFSVHNDEQGVDRLPMDVINNYFSFGVDAHIALEFHLAREAHPERFNSRLRNKMFYGQAGGKDLLKRKWKDLSNFVTLYCDGQDITSRLKELKVHSVLFLNIPSYGGGTRPWPTTTTSAFTKPRTDDGLIEVIGLTTYQLPLLQAGGHGTCIAQCKRAKIITSRTIPMQVDGEPCKLLPSILNISFKNRVCMLAKSKNSSKMDPNISEV